jgi:hypothetical protein
MMWATAESLKETSMSIVITGASGKLGRLVTDAVLEWRDIKRSSRPARRGTAPDHHGTGPLSSTKAPVGPEASSFAILTMISAPSSTGLVPLWSLKSVAV